MVTMTETAAKKISELRLEEGKPEWGLRVCARYGEATGRDRMELDLRGGGGVGWGCSAVAERHPELARSRRSAFSAAGNEYVAADPRLPPDAELCLFPPVSGGAGGDT